MPKCDLSRSHMNPYIWAQPLFHATTEQSTDVVHVQMRKHHIGQGGQVDTGILESLNQRSSARKAFALTAQTAVDEDGMIPPAYDDDVNCLIERFLHEHAVQP